MSPVELVVGADSTIGAALLSQLNADGRPVIGTSRRVHADGARLKLDLGHLPDRWTGPDVSVGYFCAAVARLDACKRDPAGSARVNIDGTLRLAQMLSAQGAFVVFLSTNHVFDGTVPLRRTDEQTCPPNEYGRQKAKAERRLLGLGQAFAIVRLTKVVSESVPLFGGWAKSLRSGAPIRPFIDMSMAPVPLSVVADVLVTVGSRRLSGIHHLSGNRDVTYAEIAYALTERMNATPSLVAPIMAQAADPSSDPPPRHTTLDIGDLSTKLGVAVPDVNETIGKALSASMGSERSRWMAASA